MKTRTIIIAVIGAVAIGGALYVRSSRHAGLAESARDYVNDMIMNADGYATHKAFLEAEADAAHRAAADAALEGAVIGQAKFDENKYQSVYFDRLIARAKEANKPDLVKWLKDLCFEANVKVTS